MTRVLLLGACRPGHFALFELGYEVVWMLPKSKALTVDLSNPYHSIVYYDDKADVEELIELARPFHQKGPFDGICTYHDDVQQLAIAIGSALDIQYDLDSELSKLVHDKHQVRQKLVQAGMDTIEFRKAETTEQLSAALNEMTLPVIVKPISGTGSQGISIIHTKTQSGKAVERLEQCNSGFPVIVESFLEGREFSVEGISEDGEHRIVAITEKFVHAQTFVELGHVVPARLTDEEHERISNYVTKVLAALEINSGLSHTEVILTRNDVQIIETHTRAGGDRIPLLVKHATDVDLYALYARQAVGEKVFDSFDAKVQPKQASAVMFVAADMDAKAVLDRIDNTEEVKSLEHVQEFKLMKEYGQNMGRLTDSFSRTAMVVVTGADVDQALSRANDACNRLTIHCSWNQGSIC